MKMLKIGTILIMVSVFTNSYSQLKDFNLSDYKLPELERRALETNFNFLGNNFNKSAYNSNARDKNNSYNGNIYLRYKHYLNSAEYQQESNLGLELFSNFNNGKTDKVLFSKRNILKPQLYFNEINRKYYNTQSFFEKGLNLKYKYDRDNLFRKSYGSGDDIERILQTHTILAILALKQGSGRIEQVQDVRHAIYLFEELSKVDRMSSDKTDEQIIELGKLISQLKNKRFFDSRLRRIAEIETVDSLFNAKDYLIKSDAKYFATLGDYWDFGNRPLRKSGTRFSAAIMPGYYFYNYNNQGGGVPSGGVEYNFRAVLIDGGFELKHEKPINLFWQNSIDLNGYAGIIEGKMNFKDISLENKIRIPNVNIGFYHNIGFYPNTRTDISLGYSLQYIKLFDNTNIENEILGVESNGAKAATRVSINYYISPKFRMNIFSSFYYIWQDSKDEVIINFDDVSDSKFLLSNLNSYSTTYGYFMDKNIYNRFEVSLIYSLF